MIWPLILVAAVLACAVGIHFRRSWRLEHRQLDPDEEQYGKETFVYVPPNVVFWILLIWGLLLSFVYGLPEGPIRFATMLAQALLILSVYYLFLLVLMPSFRNRFSARACATLWLVPAFLGVSMQYLSLAFPLPCLSILIPRSILTVIFILWGAGAVLVGGYYLLSNHLFSKKVRKEAIPEADEVILALFEAERTVLDYQNDVQLLRAEVPAPFSMGRSKNMRYLVLPHRAYTPEELSMIFRHELHHLQRCDLDTKVYLCLCRALGWFNPLVWIATKKAAEDLELSCDEIVTENMDAPGRRAYAALLLDNAAPTQGCTTCLSAAASTLRYRLKGVVDRRRRTRGTWLLVACVFCFTLCLGLFSISDARGSYASLLKKKGEIITVSDSQYGVTQKWDIPAVQAILNDLELEHVATGKRHPVMSGRFISLLLSSGPAYLSEQGLVVTNYSAGFSSFLQECYLLKSPLDWAALDACLIQE